MINVLFCDMKGIYPTLVGAENCWGEERDARLYNGIEPVVAHPPCARWSRLAESVYARLPLEKYRPGNDGGCFAEAVKSAILFGGVVEHPAETKAFARYSIPRPTGIGWQNEGFRSHGRWVCEVWQSAYGHLAPKRTWLVYFGSRPPFELRWERPTGTHAVGNDSKKRRTRPRLTGKQNISTPPEFAAELIRLADWSRGA